MIQKPLLDVLQARKPKRRPIWFMRQAGRYLPEYRAVRAKAGSFLELCYNPRLACEVTLQPLRRYDLDAAIVFADILVIPHAMGLALDFKEGEGPVVETVGDGDSVARLGRVGGTWQVEAVCETLRTVRPKLPPGCSLIGFCGGPWTVASYMIEGGSSDRATARRTAFEKPEWFGRLIDLLIEESVGYLSSQIEAGAEVVQIFDSWAGDLSPPLRELWVDRPLAEMTSRLKTRHPGVPVIIFAKGAGTAQRDIAEATKCDAVGIESELAMKWARLNLSDLCAIQGNLDPSALLGSEEALRDATREIVKSIASERHIFNLGHGIRAETDPERLALVIQTVRDFDRAGPDG